MAFGGFKGSLVGGNNSIPNPLPATGSVGVAVGDLIVAVIAQQTANTSTAVTDNLGNTYTAQNAGSLSTISGRMYYSCATVAGTLTTVNFATTSSTNDASCAVAVYEGPFLSSPIDRNPANLTADLATPYSCPASTTLAQANELVIGWFAAASTATFTAGGGFTKNVQQSQSANASASICSLAVTATTAQTPTWTGTAPTADVLGTASFKRGDKLTATVGAVAASFKTAGLARSITPLAAVTGAFASSFKDATLTYVAAAPSTIQVSWAEVSGVEGIAGGAAYTLTADVGAFAASLNTANLVYTIPARIQVSWAEVAGVEGTAAGGAAYTLTADKGAFSLTGFATGLVYSRKLSMPAALGTFVLAGTATALRAARRLAAVVGAFTLTGLATALNYGASKTLTADKGAFTLTGLATGLVYSRKLSMPAALGTFALAGQATALLLARKLTAVTGAFTLAGQATRLAATRILTAVKGAIAFTFWAAGLSKAGSYVLAANTYAITLNRVAANLVAVRKLPVTVGTFVLSGKVTGLLATRRLTAVTGAIAFTGITVNLRAIRKLTAVVGPFVLSGKVTGLLRARTLTAVTGAIAFSGVAAVLRYPRKLTADVGTFTLTGVATSLAVVKNLNAAAGSLLLTGKDVGLVYVPLSGIVAYPGDFVLSGPAVELKVKRLPPRPQFVRFVRPVVHIPRHW